MISYGINLRESYRRAAAYVDKILKGSKPCDFSLAGHDRGGRVAYRIALDHPEHVARLAVLDIVPIARSCAIFVAGAMSGLP